MRFSCADGIPAHQSHHGIFEFSGVPYRYSCFAVPICDICIGAFGPATAKEVADRGLRLDLKAPTPEFPSMTGALRDFLKNIK